MHRPMPIPLPRPPHWGRGFTLIELLAVIALLAIVGLIVSSVPAPGRSHGEGLAAVRTLAAGLRAARSEAIASNREIAFALDVERRRFRVGTGPITPLPQHIALVLEAARAEQIDAAAGSIRFFSDGSSTGGRIVVEHGAGRDAIAVDWLTGRILDDGR
jgi:general secretion pathway protein H